MSENEWNETLKMFITGAINDASHIGDNLKKQCIDYIEQLQQENKELKKYCCKRNDCGGRIKENHKLTDSEVLTEFEKWLEEKEKDTKINPVMNGTIKGILGKLQELKEGKK